MRGLGYHPDRNKKNSFSKSLQGGKFPRFHIYYDSEKQILNLHLDQKASTYQKATDHAGEYDGPAVFKEAQRIKKYVNNRFGKKDS